MYLRDLEHRLKRQPFEPFAMRLSSGERVVVPHPDAAVPGTNAVLIIYKRRGRLAGFVHLSRYHVVTIEPVNGRTRRRSKAAARR